MRESDPGRSPSILSAKCQPLKVLKYLSSAQRVRYIGFWYRHVLIRNIEGYIGGTVLARLLAIEPTSTEIRITVLVRSQEKAEKFNSISAYKNLTAVVGGMDELNKLEDLAQKADYVFNFVSSVFWREAESISQMRYRQMQITSMPPKQS